MDSSLKNFEENLKILEEKDPYAAQQLELIDPIDLRFSRTEENELNIERSYKGKTYYYHSPISARKEAEKWFQSLDLEHIETVYIYGLGLGYYYQSAKTWLKESPQRTLIFLEEDFSVLFRLCQSELGNQLLNDSQVQINFLRDVKSNKRLFNELSWIFYASPYIITSLRLYQEMNPQGFAEIKHNINYHYERKRVVVSEYLNFGEPFFSNFYPNLFKLPYAYWGNTLFNHFAQVPAIICGAGPSLNKNIDLLQDLKERCLLFAGGSALNALIPKGIIPHFGVAIDPYIYQYSRVAVTKPHHTPFFYHNRLYHQALQTVTGPILYLNGEGGYNISDWFEKELNIEGEKLDGGHNVVNFSLQIAQALGCNPIIIVGADLAFTNEEYYADGIALNLKLSDDEIRIDKPNHEIVVKKDIYGKTIQTLWKWITEAEWISDFSENHPEVTIINATEGGLGFKGIPNLSLKEVFEQFLKQRQEVTSKIEEEIQKHPLSHITTKRILELLETILKSLKRTESLCSNIANEIDGMTQKIMQNDCVASDFDLINQAILQSDMEEEIAYTYLLNNFNQVFIHLHYREIKELQSPKEYIPTNERFLRKLQIERERILFLKEVALFNIGLITKSIDYSRKSS